TSFSNWNCFLSPLIYVWRILETIVDEFTVRFGVNVSLDSGFPLNSVNSYTSLIKSTTFDLKEVLVVAGASSGLIQVSDLEETKGMCSYMHDAGIAMEMMKQDKARKLLAKVLVKGLQGNRLLTWGTRERFKRIERDFHNDMRQIARKAIRWLSLKTSLNPCFVVLRREWTYCRDTRMGKFIAYHFTSVMELWKELFLEYQLLYKMRIG
ncbi:hypothetical protein Tco_1198571, partial [Tanacetum coccineum]